MFGEVDVGRVPELKVVGRKGLANGKILATRIPIIS